GSSDASNQRHEAVKVTARQTSRQYPRMSTFKLGSRPTLMVIAVAHAALLSQYALAAGDAARGQALYAVCSTCHGPNAEGLHEMNAPALAGREAWYLVRQLENFKAGIRGTHPD